MRLKSYFSLGRPVNGEDFFGRQHELEKIFSLLQAGSAVNFFSLRRMGKSSLLMQIRYLSSFDVNWSQYTPIFLNLAALSPNESVGEYLARELGIINRRQKLDHAWHEVEQFAKNLPGNLLLLIDEAGHWLQGEERETDLSILRALQQSRSLNIVASTLYLPIVEHIKNHSNLVSPFYNIFFAFRLPSFLPSEAIELLITLCAKGGVALDKDLARELACYVGYYPNLVQEIGHTTFHRLSESKVVSPKEIETQWREDRGRQWLQTIIGLFEWKTEGGIAQSAQGAQKDFLVESLEDYGILLRDGATTLKIAPYLEDLLGGHDSTEEMLAQLQLLADLDSKVKRRKLKDRDNQVPPPVSAIYIEKGEITMGDKFIAGDNIGGIQNIGKFNHVVSNLNTSGQNDLANALTELKEAIIASQHLSDDKKTEHVEVITSIGEEAAKQSPNRTLLKMLTDGLMTTLKAIPDVAQAVTTLAPFLNKLI